MAAHDMSPQEWIAQAARLIRIRDPHVSPEDAEALAAALWERPLAQWAQSKWPDLPSGPASPSS